MKKFFTSETFGGIVFAIIFACLLTFIFIRATDPEQWYADKHDKNCEKLMNKTSCYCYDRFLETENK